MDNFFVSGLAPSDYESDERKGLPSASGIERIVLCPGSWQAERNLPEETSPYAEEGTRRHKILADGLIPDDADEELENMILRASESENEALKVAGINPDEKETKIYKEERIWLEALGENEIKRNILSGKPDKLYIKTTPYDIGLVVEYKTMYGEAFSADCNYQLRALAVLAAYNFDLSTVFCALIQPNLPKSKRLTITKYGYDEIQDANLEIRTAILNAESIYAPRIPGAVQCQYCKFRNKCPEAIAKTTGVIQNRNKNWISSPVTVDELDLYRMAEDIIKARRKVAKNQLKEDPNSIPEWKLKDGQIKKIITNGELAWNELKNIIPWSDFMSACNVNFSKLIKAYQKRTGLSLRHAKSEIEGILNGIIQEKIYEPSLRRNSIHKHRLIDNNDLNC